MHIILLGGFGFISCNNKEIYDTRLSV